MAGPRIGIALGSGSARGWSHIGVIESREGRIIEERRYFDLTALFSQLGLV